MPAIDFPLHYQSQDSQEHFVPATGWGGLLGWYDPLVAIFAQERLFKQQLLVQSDICAGERVLDVGCGTGTLALAIASAKPECKVVAVDVDANVLQLARKKDALGQVEWRLGNASKLADKDASFHHIFCTLVLHHLLPAEKVRALDEIARLLVPSGKLHIADFCAPASTWARLRFLPVRLIDGWKRTECNVRGRLPGIIRSSGFSDVSEVGAYASLLGTIRCYQAKFTGTNIT
jgi:SAM-dependent methyltransferase